MRNWIPPPWMTEQANNTSTLARGWARVRVYNQGGKWARIIWRDTYRKDGYKGNKILFTLVTPSGEELDFDAEEFRNWIRYA